MQQNSHAENLSDFLWFAAIDLDLGSMLVRQCCETSQNRNSQKCDKGKYKYQNEGFVFQSIV